MRLCCLSLPLSATLSLSVLWMSNVWANSDVHIKNCLIWHLSVPLGQTRKILGCPPCRVTVTTRIISFFSRDPYRPSFATVTVRGDNPRNIHSHFVVGQKSQSDGHQLLGVMWIRMIPVEKNTKASVNVRAATLWGLHLWTSCNCSIYNMSYIYICIKYKLDLVTCLLFFLGHARVWFFKHIFTFSLGKVLKNPWRKKEMGPLLFDSIQSSLKLQIFWECYSFEGMISRVFGWWFVVSYQFLIHIPILPYTSIHGDLERHSLPEKSQCHHDTATTAER